MTWKKSCSSSKKKKKKERGICYFAAEGFGFSKEVLRFVAKLLCKGTYKKILWAVPFFMVNTIGRTFFLDVICHWSPHLQKRCWGQHWPCTWMEGIWLFLFLPMRRCWSATKPQPRRRYIITSFFSFLSDLAPLCSDCTPVYACYFVC